MIKEIIKDPLLLSQKSTPATLKDIPITQDLIDTLENNQERCVGMAANMIGVLKNIIIFQEEDHFTIMLNPKILKTSGKLYSTDEGCLSHNGTKPTKRYPKIKVEYQDVQMKKKIKTYEGFTAQVIQHEIDHCNGVLI